MKKKSTTKSDPIRRKTLQEVVVKATPLGKNPTTARLYPKGQVSKSKIDSITKANPALAKKIGQPVRRSQYEQGQYGSASSDLIKQAVKSPSSTPAKNLKRK